MLGCTISAFADPRATEAPTTSQVRTVSHSCGPSSGVVLLQRAHEGVGERPQRGHRAGAQKVSQRARACAGRARRRCPRPGRARRPRQQPRRSGGVRRPAAGGPGTVATSWTPDFPRNHQLVDAGQGRCGVRVGRAGRHQQAVARADQRPHRGGSWRRGRSAQAAAPRLRRSLWGSATTASTCGPLRSWTSAAARSRRCREQLASVRNSSSTRSPARRFFVSTRSRCLSSSTATTSANRSMHSAGLRRIWDGRQHGAPRAVRRAGRRSRPAPPTRAGRQARSAGSAPPRPARAQQLRAVRTERRLRVARVRGAGGRGPRSFPRPQQRAPVWSTCSIVIDACRAPAGSFREPLQPGLVEQGCISRRCCVRPTPAPRAWPRARRSCVPGRRAARRSSSARVACSAGSSTSSTSAAPHSALLE